MTVQSQTSRADYKGNGVTTLFTVPFYFLDSAHLKVLRTDNSTTPPTVATLVLNSDYTVTGAGLATGGSVQTAVAPTPTQTLTVLRNVPFTQLVHYVPNDPFPAATHEQALDQLTMEVQQISEAQTHSLQLPTYEPVPPTLPSAASRAGMVLGFDSSGNVTLLPIPASVGAGDLRTDTFVANVGFNPGVTTQLTLSRAYTSLANLRVFFDSAYQGPDQLASINGAVLTFNAPVPVGVQKVFVEGGTTISLNAPAAQSVVDSSLSTSSSLYDLVANNFRLMDARFAGGDDAARVQKALDFVGARGGGVVSVSDGVNLTLTRSVYFNYPNVILRGASRYANTFCASANATGIDAQAMFKIQAANCALESIGIDGNIDNNAANVFGAVFAQEQSGLAVRTCYIRNVIGAGVTLFSSTGATPNGDFDISGNRIENVGAEGIAVLYGVNGRIERNDIFRTGLDGVRTDGVFGNLDLGVSFNVNITQNNVNKSTPPSHIRGGASEGGFLIVYGAGDKYIFVQDNFCYDNRNAGNDGIGLGQDGVHNNQGCVVQDNVVVYAGMFGIDATNQSTVQNNVILFSTQCGIKVGTDRGGNCTEVLIDGNLIVNPNNPTALFPSVQDMGIQVYSGAPPGIYGGIRIRNNKVVDTRTGTAQLTKYGLSIVFESGITMTDNEFSGNDFSRVAVAGIYAGGSGATNASGWKWKNNTYPADVPLVSGATPYVFGYDTVSLVQSAATTVTNMIGGFNGCTLDVQLADGNTTWDFSGNPNLYGNAGADLHTSASNWMQFKFYNGVWAGYRTVQ